MSRFKAGAVHAVQRCADVINAASRDDGALTEALHASGEDLTDLTTEQARHLRDSATALRAIAAAGSLTEACELLNTVLAGCRAPRLTAHEDTTPWHLHIDSDDDAEWGEWFLASSAMALAITITETQQPPLGICQGTDCDNVFTTHSPGRTRRYCSPTCSTRARVAAHRSRL
ncbi:CGNR zinc finger domain-containing protein [Micromonospora sp. NPDC049900]|uniref:CGNR zinc finger domain-containing protein n=1 Tax=Micromonospora sp. NPDC049900 TaxID=3364275 RepID=UPI0037B16F4F